MELKLILPLIFRKRNVVSFFCFAIQHHPSTFWPPETMGAWFPIQTLRVIEPNVETSWSLNLLVRSSGKDWVSGHFPHPPQTNSMTFFKRAQSRFGHSYKWRILNHSMSAVFVELSRSNAHFWTDWSVAFIQADRMDFARNRSFSRRLGISGNELQFLDLFSIQYVVVNEIIH
jgi:hypothetical protein